MRAQQELYGKSEWPTYLPLPADPSGDLATQAAQIERDGWILRRVR